MSNDTGHKAYWTNVKQIALEARGTEPSCSPADFLYEWCDGNWWTIYTHAAIATMSHTDNANAYFEHMGDSPPDVDNWCQLVTTLAHYAFLADVSAEYARIEDEAEVEA